MLQAVTIDPGYRVDGSNLGLVEVGPGYRVDGGLAGEYGVELVGSGMGYADVELVGCGVGGCGLGLSDTTKKWIMYGAIAAGVLGAGAGAYYLMR